MTEESQQAASVSGEREAFEVEIPNIAATYDGLYLTPMMPLKSGEHLMTIAQHLRIEKQLRAALSQAGAEVVKCVWTRDEDTGAYDTECGSAWHLTDGGTPAEHGQYYCHHCGKPIDDGESGE